MGDNGNVCRVSLMCSDFVKVFLRGYTLVSPEEDGRREERVKGG